MLKLVIELSGVMNNIELEQKVEELNRRLIKLEKIEKRRKTILMIKIAIYIILIIALVIIGFRTYNYLNKNIIEPINSVKNNNVVTDLRRLFENNKK